MRLFVERRRRLFWCASLSALASLTIFVACGSGDSGSSFSGSGTEQTECSSNGECADGFVCRFNVCVEGDSGGGMGATGGTTNGSGGTSSTGGTSDAGASSSSGGEGNASSDGGASAAGAAGQSGSSSGAGGTGGVGGDGAECNGTHPLLGNDPPTRYCAEGDCYCPGADECLAADVAAECCENNPLCGENGELAGIECSSMHPIIGPPRTCESGFCLCSEQGVIDACFPSDVAEYCCPPDVALQCVQ
jgi:hypothetical protein